MSGRLPAIAGRQADGVRPMVIDAGLRESGDYRSKLSTLRLLFSVKKKRTII
jgi:hypothetical protein